MVFGTLIPNWVHNRRRKLNVHNSGWVQSPGYDILKNTDAYDSLRSYVEGVVGSFKNDHRILIWDLFNGRIILIRQVIVMTLMENKKQHLL